MKILWKILMFFSLFLINLSIIQAQEKHIYPPENPLWNPDSLGNHRAVLRLDKNKKRVIAKIPWRNRNISENQLVYVVDSSSNKLISNIKRYEMNPEHGIIGFQANKMISGNIYYVYYLPYELKDRPNYPNAYYKTSSEDSRKSSPKISKNVSLLRLEAVDKFNGNGEMEKIATKEEIRQLLKNHKDKDYLVFPESRKNIIKMKDWIPEKWTKEDIEAQFNVKAQPGENFTFQFGVWAFKKKLEGVVVHFSDFTSKDGVNISSDLFTCFNQEGVDYTGKAFSKKVDIEKEKIKSLWCGLTLPKDLPSGKYKGEATIVSNGDASTTVNMILTIDGEPVENGGISEPWTQTRLKWLDSDLAQENEVVEPYTALKQNGDTLSLLGRELILSEEGLPAQIQTFFTEQMTDTSEVANPILSRPFQFHFIDSNGEKILTKTTGTSFDKIEPGLISWNTNNTSSLLDMKVKGLLEFDGHMEYEIKVIANKKLKLKDVILEIPFLDEAAKYILGLGNKGGLRPNTINWNWDVENKNQDGLWLGNVNRGLQFSLRDENYERPLNTNFYLQKPLRLPKSWGNENKGGINLTTNGNEVLMEAYSGERIMEKGDTLFFNLSSLITPFHKLQTDQHFNNRYYHAFDPIKEVIKSGSNVINVHHANEINPYINYPFIATDEMKSYVEEAHKAGLKVKIYNTIREVSNRLYELYPIKNLDHEIFSQGKGQGYSWLQEHLDDDYIAAWYVPQYKDAAIINSGMNRWHNYYVEGMNWLVENIGIDGIYLDDVAFDRITMKRIKRVLTQNGKEGLIDLHSANQFNERDGFINSAHLYMEHFPYLDRLWFGEYFDYENNSPDFYLTEVSGIPFGLMGEMLQDGGNQWRGLLYGMTNRMPYQEKKPDAIWKVWDEFGMEGAEMIGYWVTDNPIKTNNENVLVTIYKQKSKTLVSIASWEQSDVDVNLIIDWERLNMNPKNVKFHIPKIRDFQSEKVLEVGDSMHIKKNQGLLLIIE